MGESGDGVDVHAQCGQIGGKEGRQGKEEGGAVAERSGEGRYWMRCGIQWKEGLCLFKRRVPSRVEGFGEGG